MLKCEEHILGCLIITSPKQTKLIPIHKTTTKKWKSDSDSSLINETKIKQTEYINKNMS